LILVLSIVAIVHEFGHFIVAKAFKMTVNEFSIGFGPKITQKKYKGTMYSLRWIPLGGYVALEGEDNESTDINAFSNKAPWQRIIVLLAGVTFNAILAVTIFLSVNSFTPTFGTKITDLDETSVAYISGLRDGDHIVKIGDKETHVYQDVATYNDLTNKDVTVEYIRDGKLESLVVYDAVKSIGYMGVYFDTTKLDDIGGVFTYVQMVEPGMPASKADVKAGDKILKVNGMDTTYSEEVVNIISQNPDKEVELVVLREDEEVTLKVTPKSKKTFNLGLMGFEEVKTNLKYSYYKSIATISQIVGSYVDLFQGKVAVTQLSGIVGIGEVVSQTEGLLDFLSMMAMISLAVGIANILPFPPLDGGKIVLVLIEWITRKKVSLKVETILSMIGFALLILLTIFVTINDIIRIL
ncbi:MAG: RIP metalloprotease RseP, partial [Clostridia bacterium]|nr:RIP metalloprotease RseP [Clostridia bacterium]